MKTFNPDFPLESLKPQIKSKHRRLAITLVPKPRRFLPSPLPANFMLSLLGVTVLKDFMRCSPVNWHEHSLCYLLHHKSVFFMRTQRDAFSLKYTQC